MQYVDKNKKHKKHYKTKVPPPLAKDVREGSRVWAHGTIVLCCIVIVILTATMPSVATCLPLKSTFHPASGGARCLGHPGRQASPWSSSSMPWLSPCSFCPCHHHPSSSPPSFAPRCCYCPHILAPVSSWSPSLLSLSLSWFWASFSSVNLCQPPTPPPLWFVAVVCGGCWVSSIASSSS